MKTRSRLVWAAAGLCTVWGVDPLDVTSEERVAAEPMALYDYATLPSNLRVAVILYNFNNTGPNAPSRTPPIDRLPVSEVVNLTFTGRGRSQATGSVDEYYRELTDNRMRLTGAVYGWVTLPRADRVWRHKGTDGCSFGFAPISLAASHVCSDPIQPLPPGDEHVAVPAHPTLRVLPGRLVIRPTVHPKGSDWCNGPGRARFQSRAHDPSRSAERLRHHRNRRDEMRLQRGRLRRGHLREPLPRGCGRLRRRKNDLHGSNESQHFDVYLHPPRTRTFFRALACPVLGVRQLDAARRVRQREQLLPSWTITATPRA